MSKISYFKDLKSRVPEPAAKELEYYLQRIKDGKNEKLITQLRLEVDPDKKKALKNNLPAVTFCGQFTLRNKDNLKQGSGFAILDFDKLENVIQEKELLKANDYVFAAWISPSGNGLKALVKIPIISNDIEYKHIFKQLQVIFKNVDPSGSDITRLCFESYDPDIYLNYDSEKFIPNYEIEPSEIKNLGAITNIPIIDGNEIANRLIEWFKKKFDSSNRNSSLFKLAIAFNDFGVNKSICWQCLQGYAEADFTESEINSIINSAYKNTAKFGTKQFEDKTKSKILKDLVFTGKKDKEIIEKFKEFNTDKILSQIQFLKENVNTAEFWDRDEKGKIQISAYRFKLYLESLNYLKYYPTAKTKTFLFIKKENNFIDIVTEYQVKDEVLEQLIENNSIDAFDASADNISMFTQKYLSMIATANIQVDKDTVNFAMLYYNNLALKITEDSIQEIDYNDMEALVWKSQIIDRDYEDVDHHESQFRSFIWFASGQNRDKYNTMKSVIGYLLHSYKTSANNRAIILNDETISDNPNGGSGKGIIINSIGHMKKLSVIDGKTFDFNKSFAFQTVNTDTQILAFDDVKKSFDFERLFSVITEGITIEYKGKDAVKIPVQDSPKIIISTNYTIKADGGSYERRIFEIEMSDYFGLNHTPQDQFGNLLYDEWNKKEWNRFDKFMINCLQFYLKNGLVKSKTNNLDLRKFINQTSQEFYEYTIIDNSIKIGERIIKKDALELFLEINPDSRKYVTARTFIKWCKKYSDYLKLDYVEGNSNGSRWFIINKAKGSFENPIKIEI